MVNYWITVSNNYRDALDRQKNRRWWYLPNRDEIKAGDRAVIYQRGSSQKSTIEGREEEGEEEQEEIDRYPWTKYMIIGDFTITRDLGEDRHGRHWIRTSEKKFLWPRNRAVDFRKVRRKCGFRRDVKRNNWGQFFRSKSWIHIKKPDYDVIINEYKRRV